MPTLKKIAGRLTLMGHTNGTLKSIQVRRKEWGFPGASESLCRASMPPRRLKGSLRKAGSVAAGRRSGEKIPPGRSESQDAPCSIREWSVRSPLAAEPDTLIPLGLRTEHDLLHSGAGNGRTELRPGIIRASARRGLMGGISVVGAPGGALFCPRSGRLQGLTGSVNYLFWHRPSIRI